ncbi:TolC family protein [Methylotetracoccus oryzae]|uniref:TolC family protein n=1 Tax=Methylotetracoccus oryzae TaxID=1919059 RepID=UPI00111A1C3F|nr:TolC family protein [Methylotetracoccus oryzae]
MNGANFRQACVAACVIASLATATTPATAAREARKPLALAAPEAETLHKQPAAVSPGLTLQQAIDLAFERNPSLRAAAERYGEAQAKVEQSVAAFYPRVSARVAYNYTDNPAEAFFYIVSQRRFNESLNINDPGWVENFRPEVVGVWSLFRGGQDFYKRKAAELGVEQTELEQSALHNHLAAAVTSAYYALAIAPRQVEVAQRSLEAVTSELLQARARHAEGTGLKSDVLSLEVRLAEARESEVQALNAVELARSGLMALLGGNDGKPLAIADTEGPEPATGVVDLAKVLEEAHARRPELQAADRLVQMRVSELQAERGAHLPRVNAYAAYGQNLRSPGFSTAKQNTSIGISAELDLFTGGETTAKVSAAERRVAEAEAQREQNRLEIEKEVRDAHTRIKDAMERLRVTRAAVAAAEEALRQVHEQYRGGATTVTRYLEAEADRAGAQARSLAARYQAYVTEANLKKAAGYWR